METVHKRHALWSPDSTWKMLLRHVQAAADAEDNIDWDINGDSTVVRAHQHAAGAPKARRRRCGAPQKGPREDRFSNCRWW